MTVTKTVYNRYVSVVGTIAEVLTQLTADNVPGHKVQIFYNGTNMTAVYYL